MLPENNQNELITDFQVAENPGKTYALDFENDRIVGMVDGLEAIRQSIQLMLDTQRFIFEIFSWNYGTELDELIGEPIPLVYAKIKENIADALMQDDRITSVENFEFHKNKNAVICTFDVSTNVGELQIERNVKI